MTQDQQPLSQFIIRTFPVGPLQCNCSIIGDRLSSKALVVDPGGDADQILGLLNELNLTVVGIIHTHAHLDHILASGVIKEATGAPIYLHEGDKFLWDMVGQQCVMFGVPPVTLPEPDHFMEDDQALNCCGGVAIHTPGHTPGSISFWFEEYKTLIAGDTLFQGSIGRTDLPGGNFDQIITSIKERIYTLDDDAVVVTGHGPNTAIGSEKTGNSFVRG
ncbi:MBL fold metallo-hydrolase [Porticoccaceae bacterium]|jgi:glyoxylase-like metal-dependent hydrolase (beta-lactamase superfamily II)|nr:MBL fold metallo-hydrolase [Porticoccaceae bacterium]MDC0054231.1 MBL fold metallo-hydrolase [Gammaproteobacteria bacterium]MDA7571403.1 MBL fold metallo-hydrolase [Porticoccaceae bacterium]MDA8598958.1 MBL fold metallo-hydrolase [Porticoccaceae bacterium]MDA8941947.1 MBL fold metallo-hydrolase [Porticoccaceae bacterium]|tara:strand:- start:5419 stop:6072 length:654 start_codon:yes stop_codon:yes gene_type:complete